MPSLPHFIVHIILVCAQEKVIWITAARVVASVAHENSFRDWSLEMFVRYPVCLPEHPVNAHDSVTLAVDGPLPNPAIIRILYYPEQEVLGAVRLHL